MGTPRPCLIRNVAQAPILAKRKTRAMKQRAEERAKVASKSAALAANDGLTPAGGGPQGMVNELGQMRPMPKRLRMTTKTKGIR